jgi:hypothetical protein
MSETNSSSADAYSKENPREASPEEVPEQSKEQSPEQSSEQSSGQSSEEAEDSEPQEPGTNPEAKAESSQSPDTATAQNPWQAIWSPQYNAYYFYNNETQETTWTNPLSPSDGASSSQQSVTGESSRQNTSQSTPQYDALQAAAIAQGIDPALAYLDPTLAAGPAGSSSHLAFTAKFNAKSGAFARPDARDPTHMSEYERAKRMSEFYFDVGAWEKEVAERYEAEADAGGKKRKRPTKKDLVWVYSRPLCFCYLTPAFRNGTKSRKNKRRLRRPLGSVRDTCQCCLYLPWACIWT